MAARGGLTGQTACARTPSWVSPLGSGSPFRPGPGAQGSEGCSQRSAALGIRLPGGVTRATESSPRFLPLRLSEDGAGADPEDGIRVGLGRGAQSCRASVEGQPAGRRGRASDTFSVDRAAEAVGPTISSGLKERPRLSSHKFQSHGNAQAHRRGYSNMRLRTWLGFGWSCASACGWARRGAMPMGFEPSWSSDRTALCAKQRAPLYATHALVLSILAGRPRGACRSSSHVLLPCILVRLGTLYNWACRSVASKHAGGQGPAR